MILISSPMTRMNKVILIDTSGILFACIFAWERVKQMSGEGFVLPAHCMYFNGVLSALKKIGVDRDDTVIMALEGKSFRKKIYAPYKAQREGDRAKHTLINWDDQFAKVNKMHKELDEATNWKFVRVWDGLEADDVCAIGVRYFSDKECIVVTGDKDLFQLLYYKNCKIFSVNKKTNNTKGMYETTVKNPLKIIADKAEKGDIADNIIPDKLHDTEHDYNLRYTIVNLLELPENIENAGRDAIKTEMNKNKQLNLDKLPNFKNVKEKFLKIYEKDNVVTYEYCEKLQFKRDEKKKVKARERYQQKKLAKTKLR